MNVVPVDIGMFPPKEMLKVKPQQVHYLPTYPKRGDAPYVALVKTAFVNIGATDAPSGFAENLDYGFGVNNLTPGQKKPPNFRIIICRISIVFEPLHIGLDQI